MKKLNLVPFLLIAASCNANQMSDETSSSSETSSETGNNHLDFPNSIETGYNPECGNSIVDYDEECDDGELNISSDYGEEGQCSDLCTFVSFCGDGEITNEESCDQGQYNNPLNHDYVDHPPEQMCSAHTCTRLRFCGDGIIDWDYEECDNSSHPGCSDKCRILTRAFVTSGAFRGDFAFFEDKTDAESIGEAFSKNKNYALEIVDKICNQAAESAPSEYKLNKSGNGSIAKYKAWIHHHPPPSLDNFNLVLPDTPIDRFSKNLQNAYIRVDGVVIANNWMDLVDGELLAPISITDKGFEVSPDAKAWTHVLSSGRELRTENILYDFDDNVELPKEQYNDCGEWNFDITSKLNNGLYGLVSATDQRWSHFETEDINEAQIATSCGDFLKFYCFEQFPY